MNRLYALLVGTALLLSSCSSPTPADYAAEEPTLDLRTYLNGPLEAHGILFDYTGKPDLRFHVAMTGRWNGNTGTLEEHFTYSDGRKETRTWTITFRDDHHFTGTAADVVGEATGSQYGNSMNMRYTLDATRPNGDTITLSMDDWMYLMDEKTLINRTTMRKFGLKVGELVITFRKL